MGGKVSDNFALARALADLYGQYVDRPTSSTFSNPTYGLDTEFPQFQEAFNKIIGRSGTNPQQHGTLQNPPSYRGIRMLLPESTSSIPQLPANKVEDSYKSLELNRAPNYNALHQALLGEMIVRGYPVLGGSGQMFGKERGFNPVGFGQR